MDNAEFMRKVDRLKELATRHGVHETMVETTMHEYAWRWGIRLKPPIVALVSNTALLIVILTLGVSVAIACDTLIGGKLSTISVVMLPLIAYPSAIVYTVKRFRAAKRLGWPRWEDL